jgi:hypothetical protein
MSIAALPTPVPSLTNSIADGTPTTASMPVSPREASPQLVAQIKGENDGEENEVDDVAKEVDPEVCPLSSLVSQGSFVFRWGSLRICTASGTISLQLLHF